MKGIDWKLPLAAVMLWLGIAVATPAAEVDPVWGHYASLPGRTAAAGPQGYRLRWSWAKEGEELVQEYLQPGSGELIHRDVFRPGAEPGTLILTASYMGNKQWLGRVQPDGTVLFIGKGLLGLPYVAGFNAEGQWEIRRAKVKGGQLVSAEPPTRYNRFFFDTPAAAPGDGQQVAAAAAAVDPATAAVALGPAESSAAAAATAAPAAAPVAPVGDAPAGPSMRGLERFVGKKLVAGDGNGAIRMSREGGRVLIEVWGPGDQPQGRYVLARKGDKLEMLESAFGYGRQFSAIWVGDKELQLRSSSGVFAGYRIRFILVARQAGIEVVRTDIEIGGWNDRELSVARMLHYDPPPSPVLEGAALAEQNALNRRFWQALANDARNQVERGQWLLANGEGGIDLTQTMTGYRQRSVSIQYGGTTTEQYSTAVFDEASGTWKVSGAGAPVREYVAGVDGQTWTILALPGDGVTPEQAAARQRTVTATPDDTLVIQMGGRQQFRWAANTEVTATWAAVSKRKQAEAARAKAQLDQYLADEAARQSWEEEEEWDEPARPTAAWLALERMVDGAKAREAQSRAELDATYAEVNRRAAEERARQARADADARARDAVHAREVLRREELARQAREAQRQQEAAQAQQAARQATAAYTAAGPASLSAAGSASTRARADGCVGQPVTSPHQCGSSSGLKGIVSNQCDAPVDVRVCFMTASGWNCQARYGLAPQATWEPGLCSANGAGVFRSVRYSDSSEPLASP